MSKLTQCLWFDDNGQQAAELYVSIIPNSRITSVTSYPSDQPGPGDKVMTVEFELDGTPYVALNGGPHFKHSEAYSIQVSAADQAEVDSLTERLTAGGGETGPCGWVKDQFGLSWQVVPQALPALLSDPNPLRASAAMQAMMKMTKIDIQALHDAADAAA
jgi:predicted 3-demethylubiquinone-9 3-methyltransferase (glyoxalase superfamily)